MRLELHSERAQASLPLRQRLKAAVLQRKLSHPIVFSLLVFATLCFSATVAYAGFIGGVLLLAGVVAPPLVFCIIAYPRFGILTMLVAAYLIMWVMRMGVNFPLGTLMDGLQALLIFGLLLKLKVARNLQVFRNPISYLILIWICYNLLQVANPSAESRMAWLYTLRSVAIIMLMYFIFFYHIRSAEFIRLILKLWIGLATFAAAYGFVQEHYGYLPFEARWVNSDPLITDLYFIAGHWRKFSIFSDPVAFAYNMVASSVLCFSLCTGPVPKWKKLVLIALGAFQIMSMLYSGTRGAYVLLPAALAMFCILKFNRNILIVGAIGALIMGALIFVPTGNPTIVRFQSAFRPSEDASFNVRAINQKRIQPYIQSHPLGGGLGATGVWGQRFAPWSYLASFPPDSGYVRVAVELGWVGLFLFCLLMFMILKTGINNYYAIRDPELKSYCLAMTLIVFALNIGNYPQEALVQFPSNVYFYLEVALINVLLTIDKQTHGFPTADA